jgi:hypothetical protein
VVVLKAVQSGRNSCGDSTGGCVTLCMLTPISGNNTVVSVSDSTIAMHCTASVAVAAYAHVTVTVNHSISCDRLASELDTHNIYSGRQLSCTPCCYDLLQQRSSSEHSSRDARCGSCTARSNVSMPVHACAQQAHARQQK